jgi:predicted porin
MNKKIVALAVAAAFAVPVAASAQTTLFGQFKYEVGYIDSINPTLDLDSDSAFVHSYKGTRLGVRGSEDLGGGTSAIYRFQAGFDGVNNVMRNNTFRLNEENWVGLRGGFGTLQLGRSDTAMKKTGGNYFRAFTDTLAEPSLNVDRTARAEGIHYTTPSIAGFNGYLTVEPNGFGTDTYWAVGGDYKLGQFLLAAAYESFAEDLPFAAGVAADADQSNWQVGGKWNFGQGDVGVLYQAVNDGDDDVILVPVNFKVTPSVNLRAAAKYTSPDVGSSFTNWGVGAQYMFSPRTEAFVNVWIDDAQGQTLTATNNLNHLRPTPGVAGSVSDDSTHFGFGLRHSF